VIVDPGIGFGKTAAQNFELLRRLPELHDLGYPVLVGPSRKSFLGALPSALTPSERLEGTLAAVAVAVMNGASIVRVHDVRAVRRAVDVVDAVRRP
jgi:dihydropteroate synthase